MSIIHAWVDITSSASAGRVTGVIDHGFLGVIAIMSMPGHFPIPTLAAKQLLWLALMLLGFGGWSIYRRVTTPG